MKRWTQLAVVILIGWCASAVAGLDPRSAASDPRVRVVPYSPINVVQLVMHTGIATTIQLFPGERYVNSAGGALLAVKVIPLEGQTDKVIIKPVLSEADGNLTIYTDQRVYLFEVKIRDPKKMANGYTNDVRDEQLTYMLYFTYPDEESRIANRQYQQAVAKKEQEKARQCEQTGTVNPAALNFAYRMSGSRAIAPVAVYDDGVFTYFTFDQRAKIPSVFSADTDRDETTLNTRMEGKNVLVVEQLAERFTLRLGKDVVTVMQANGNTPASHLSTSEGSFNGW